MLGRVEEKADQRGRSLIVSSFVFCILYSVFVVKPHFSILVNQLCVHTFLLLCFHSELYLSYFHSACPDLKP